MSEIQKRPSLQEVLPKSGLVVSEKGGLSELLCKPKLLPLKSITLQKLEEMEAQVAALNQQQQAANRAQTGAAKFASQ
ncbi:BBSome-interacting protein 1 [Scenedesmus sp. NREL 46B-D3]|nr:BBSome-interacting protein 1 [Scenedesmus sp. NREL 46B-D3]